MHNFKACQTDESPQTKFKIDMYHVHQHNGFYIP